MMCFTGCLSGDEPMNWKKARKKPVIVEFREVIGEREQMHTREGVLWAYKGKDYIIRGVEGEVYPIKREIFGKTYEILEEGEALKKKEAPK